MKRAIAAAGIAAVVVLGIGIVVSGGSGSAQQPGIAYVTGTGDSAPTVWLANAQGRSGRRLGPGTNPRLSPNGQLIAVSSAPGQSQALTVYNASGGVAAHFFNSTEQSATAEAFSPDSRYLAVVLSSTDPVSDAASGLAVIDTRSESVRMLAYGTIYGASFAPDGSDRIVYARASTSALSAAVNIDVVAPDGTAGSAITRDGRSLYPVWGRLGIAFDRERLRRHADPEYQLYLMNPDGSHPARISEVHVYPLLDGLIPLAFSDDGSRLLAEYVGADTSQAWTVNLQTHAVAKLTRFGHSVLGAGISHNGDEVLIDRGGFLHPPDSGVVEELQFSGPGATTLISHGSGPSWNL